MILGLLLAGCSRSGPSSGSQPQEKADPRGLAGQVWFVETAERAGLDFRHVSGARGQFWIPEMMTGGVCLLDYDGDGFLDVFCVQGGSLDPSAGGGLGNRLYRNLRDGTFADVTERAGIIEPGYGMGCGCADYDGDGDTDLYVTHLGPNVLYRNNGDGTFGNVTAQAGVGDVSWGTSCAFFDYDLDGHLDLVIANYLHWSPGREIECYSRGGRRDYCSPMNYQAPARDTLYRNRGDGTFEDVTVAAGLDQAFGNGLGVACADYNQDGWPDFYIANDAMPNQLWLNQGNGRFKDEAMLRGCAVNALGIAEAGMGVVTVDIQNDGWLDLFITHLVGEANRLYLNTNGHFIDWVGPDGPGAVSWPYTGFGVGFADFDHDGNADLFVANGRVKFGANEWDPQDPYAEPNHLLRGRGGGAFEEVPNAGSSQPLIANSRGAALGDLDNDGDIDLVVINRDGPAHLLRNVAPKKGHWLEARVRNRKGTDAIGALVRAKAGDRIQYRQVAPNEGYCSSNDPRIHFGLGPATAIDRLTVRWPGGAEETFGPLAADRLHEIQEGLGESESR